MEQPIYNKRGPKVKLTDEQRSERQKQHSKNYYNTHKEYFIKYRQEARQRNKINELSIDEINKPLDTKHNDIYKK